MVGKISVVLIGVLAFGFMLWKSLPRYDLHLNPIEVQGIVDSVSVYRGSIFIRYAFSQGNKFVKRERIFESSDKLRIPERGDKLSIIYAKNFPDYVEVKEYPKVPTLILSLIPITLGFGVFLIAILGVSGKIDLNKYYT